MTYNQYATTMADLEEQYMAMKMLPDYGPEHYAWDESDLLSIKMQRLAARNHSHARQYHNQRHGS